MIGRSRSLDSERGSGLVAGITLIFGFTFGALVWLAHDVDRSISNRSTAGSVAFQSARSGAQAASVADLRRGEAPRIDAAAAESAARATAQRLFESYGVTGTISVVVGVDEVSTIVTISEAGLTVTGSATVRSERAP